MYPLQRWPRILQALHSILWTTITAFAPLVTIVYWGLLADASVFNARFSAWQELSVHALNTAFALFEIFLTNCGPQPPFHIIFLVLILAAYLGVAYITRATQGFYGDGIHFRQYAISDNVH
ncbi:hypothetical protein Clacol_010611 [Clathrus columnatus]|uniref:Uncharacterized protein n=1 Tax=Clathrus columnatus TaxID=1419009 RepID=A0AAV5AUE5_9AGAM|nr:hypothetical protein Clacol_010611 [Clathrus columnatus]